MHCNIVLASSLPIFSGIHVAQSLFFCIVFCWSLLSFFFCPLKCLSFNLQLLSLVSANFSLWNVMSDILFKYISDTREELWNTMNGPIKNCLKENFIFLFILRFIYSETCLSNPLYITTSFVSRPYLFLPCVFLCIQHLYNDPLSNATNDRVLWVTILHITTIRGLLSNRKLDNK